LQDVTELPKSAKCSGVI